MEYFETHAHYDDERFNKDREEILNSLKQSGVTACINVGCDVESSRVSVEYANKYDFVYAICGIHPNEIVDDFEQQLNELEIIEDIARNNKRVVAIGEIGLDYHWVKDKKEEQKVVFIKQIEIANKLHLPICIHTRDAVDDTIEILRKYKVEKDGVLHCCPFNRELVKHGIENGYYIAFGGTSTFKSSKNANEIIEMVPMDKILIETDSPYLAPEPMRGKRNDSRNLKYIVEKLAQVKGISPEKMAEITYENAKRLFNV